MVKVKNAREVIDGVGWNGPENSTDYLGDLNYTGTVWSRVEIHPQAATAGNGDGHLVSSMQASFTSMGFPINNLKVLWLTTAYGQWVSGGVDQCGWSNMQSPFFLNNNNTNGNWGALGIKGPNGHSTMWAIEGPNEVNNGPSWAGGFHYPDQTSIVQDPLGVAFGNGNYPDAQNLFIAWGNTMAAWRNQNRTFLNTTAGHTIKVYTPTLNGPYGGQGSSWPWNNPTPQTDASLDGSSNHWYANVPPGRFSVSKSIANFGTQYSGATVGNSNAPWITSEGVVNAPGHDLITRARSGMLAICDAFASNANQLFFFGYRYDASNTNGDANGFAWIRGPAGNRLPFATCLHNFNNLLSIGNNYNSAANALDQSPSGLAKAFTPGFDSSNLTISGINHPCDGGNALVLPKSDGSTMIAVWDEPDFTDAQNLPASAITVTFNSVTHASLAYKVYDISGSGGAKVMNVADSTTPYMTGTGSSVTVNSYGMPVLIELPAVTVSAAPPTPSGFSVISTSSTRATVQWTAGTTGQSNSPTSYKMEFQQGGTSGTWTAQATIDATNTQYLFYGLQPSTQYYYRMTAINSVGASTPTSALNSTTKAQQAQTTPIIRGTNYASFRDDGDNVTSKTLSLPSTPQTGSTIFVFFNGYAGTGSNSNAIVAPAGATEISRANYDGGSEVTWCWKITSNVTSNSFIFSNFDSANNAGWKIIEVTNAISYDVNHGPVSSATATNISWPLVAPTYPNCLRLTELSVQFAPTSFGNGSTGVATLLFDSATTTPYHNGVLLSVDPTVAGPVSLAITGGTVSDTDSYLSLNIYGAGVPAQVTGVTQSNLTSTGVNIAFTAVTGATSYEIDYSTNSGASWNILASLPPTSTTYTASGLSPDTPYQFRVMAANDSGLGAASTPLSVRTAGVSSLQYIQSTIGVDGNGNSSVTATLANPPTVGNTLVFYFTSQRNTTNLALVPGLPASAAKNVINANADTNGDSIQMMWTQDVVSTTPASFTYTGYVDMAALCIAEVQGVVSVDTPSHSGSLGYADGQTGFVSISVSGASSTPSLGIYGVCMDIAPDSWGTMPAGIQLIRSSTGNSASSLVYHQAALLKIDSSVTAGSKNIPYVLGNGVVQGAAPMFVGMNLIGATQAIQPGPCSLTFGTTTPTSQQITINPASGTVTFYQVVYSTSSSMT